MSTDYVQEDAGVEAIVPGTGTAKLKKEFLTERQGKNFVLYQGLLDLSHQMGLTNIRTEIVQIPRQENNMVAIVTAVATYEKDGKVQSYTGVGDAAPNNVAPAMQTCLLRMAETRAKARAMRDGTNVGVAALEELGAEEPQRGYGNSRATRPAQRSQPAPRPTTNDQPRKPWSGGNEGSAVKPKLCPECNAPEGNRHVPPCSKATVKTGG